MSKWQPTVSVVMCTYNGEKFLREQMDSIVAQTYTIKELLVFDDGSTDATEAIINEYAQNYSWINFFKNETNLGHNLNFEQAIKAASGEVVAVSDQDDIWHKEKLRKLIDAWDSSYPVIYCDSNRFEDVINPNFKRRLYHRFSGTDPKKLYFYNSISGHAMLIRKDFVPVALPFEKDIYYDWWTAFVASCNGGVAYLDEVLVYQRVHDKNVSIDNKKKSREERYQKYRSDTARHIKKFVTAPNLKEEDRKVGEAFYKALADTSSFSKRMDLFLVMVKYRKTIFYGKRRKIPVISHIKHAYRMAFY